MRLTDLLIPTYRQMLQTLNGLLEKSESQISGPSAEEMLSARLAPDMYPLSSQIRFAVFQAQEAVFRLRGRILPDWLNDLAAEGRNAGDRPGSVSDAKSRIREALAFLETLDPAALDARDDLLISLELPNGIVFDLTAEQYARDWALAQFYFHINIAYAIIRNHGVQIGKADYVPHMFAYLRTEPAPQDRVHIQT